MSEFGASRATGLMVDREDAGAPDAFGPDRSGAPLSDQPARRSVPLPLRLIGAAPSTVPAVLAAPVVMPATRKAPLPPGRQMARVALVVLAAVGLSLAAQLVVVSGFEHRSVQQSAYDKFREQLAAGKAPVSEADTDGHHLPLGTPLAVIEIPAIHVRQVVFEGTTGGVLMSGPGHRRGTPLPGQAGTSAIYGRQASYGGPFRAIHQLRKGAKIKVTTGEGVSTYAVIGVRRPGDLAPTAPANDKGRLLLITAQGTPFVPSGVLRVDAELMTPTLVSSSVTLPSAAIAKSEGVMAADTATVWALVLWLQALIIVAVGIVWSWHRWGRLQTWIVFLPVTALVGLLASNQFLKLLPNLL